MTGPNGEKRPQSDVEAAVEIAERAVGLRPKGGRGEAAECGWRIGWGPKLQKREADG